MLMSVLLVYIAIIAPVDTAFLEPKLDAMFIINRTIDVVFFGDFILQFNLATPSARPLPFSPVSKPPRACVRTAASLSLWCGVGADKYGRLLTDRREITGKYVRGWMMTDLLSLVPFDLLVMLEIFSGLDQIQARSLPIAYPA